MFTLITSFIVRKSKSTSAAYKLSSSYIDLTYPAYVATPSCVTLIKESEWK